ncbi:MAG: Uncharacterised protein [Cellulomonadaceae bacterium TMED98]|nr:MAG: Uncharacterised protein [Cellulomonadaceae bacterium TMED98]
MNAGVVKLDSLTDPVGTRAQDDDFFPVGRLHLRLLVITGVVIRGVGGKFAGAGIHGLKDRSHAGGVADGSNVGFCTAPQLRDLHIRQTVFFCGAENLGAQIVGLCDLLGHLVNQSNLIHKPGIYSCGGMYLLHGGTLPKCPLHGDNTAVGRSLGPLQ